MKIKYEILSDTELEVTSSEGVFIYHASNGVQISSDHYYIRYARRDSIWLRPNNTFSYEILHDLDVTIDAIDEYNAQFDVGKTCCGIVACEECMENPKKIVSF